ncbi:adenylate/guanylate cyclase domain-containing protein [Candidatus Neomarinimicrobiota bacterium]
MPSSSQQVTSDDLNIAVDFASACKTSILVILFTDIESSTQAGSELGNVAAQMQRQIHDQIVSDSVTAESKGKVIKSTGDGVLATFADPTLAVQRALTIQDKFFAYNLEKDSSEQIWVRIGLDMGQVLIEEKASNLAIFGNHVNRAARVMSLADGGHIYVSGRIYDDAVAWLKHMEINGEIGWEFYGKCQLKGVDPSPEVYEVFKTGAIDPKPPEKKALVTTTPIPKGSALEDVESITVAEKVDQIKPVQTHGRWQLMPNDILLDNWTVVSAFDLLEDYESIDQWDMYLSCLAVLIESIVIHGKIYVDATYSEAWRYKTSVPSLDIYEPYRSTEQLSDVVVPLYLDKRDEEKVAENSEKRLAIIRENPQYADFIDKISKSDDWNTLIKDTYFAEQPDGIELLGALKYLEMSRLLRLPYVPHFLRTPIVLLNASVFSEGYEDLSSAKHLIQYVEKMRASSMEPINEFYQKHVFDLSLPSILSIVLHNSGQPGDVIDEALKLRDAEAVKEFRNYCMLMDAKVGEGDIAFLNEAMSTLKYLSDKMAVDLNGIRREKVWGIGHELGLTDTDGEKGVGIQPLCYLPRLMDESNSVKTIGGELSRVFGTPHRLKGFWQRELGMGAA